MSVKMQPKQVSQEAIPACLLHMACMHKVETLHNLNNNMVNLKLDLKITVVHRVVAS